MTAADGELQGYGVVITGAAGALGAAAARRFVQAGARVVLADIDAQRVQAVAQAMDPGATRVIGVACDVADAPACDRLVAAAEGFFGAAIDVFVANAGVGYVGTLSDTDPAQAERVIRVNVLGSIFSAQAALRSLVRSPRASLLFTASLQGVIGRSRRSLYTTSKHAIVGLTKALALDYGPLGVRVNAIAPAATDTPFLHAQLQHDNADADAAMQRAAAALPLGHLPSAEDFAEAACFLASPRARSISGHNLLLDCGAAAGVFVRPAPAA